MADVQRKKRNRLQFQRVGKLTYIAFNNVLLTSPKTPKKACQDRASDLSCNDDLKSTSALDEGNIGRNGCKIRSTRSSVNYRIDFGGDDDDVNEPSEPDEIAQNLSEEEDENYQYKSASDDDSLVESETDSLLRFEDISKFI